MGTHPSDYEDKSSTHPSDYEDKSSTHPSDYEDKSSTAISDRNLYSQFIIDLPRLTLYLNEKLCNDSSEQVYDYLYDRLNKRQLRFCLYFLTQTSLADYYFKEYKKLKDNMEHLVGDGSYVVRLDTTRKTINVSKNFRKIYIDDNVNFELDFTTLNLDCDLEKDITCYSWDYEFQDDSFGIIELGSKTQ